MWRQVSSNSDNSDLRGLVFAGRGADERAAPLVEVVEHDLAESVLHVQLLVVDKGCQRPELLGWPLKLFLKF